MIELLQRPGTFRKTEDPMDRVAPAYFEACLDKDPDPDWLAYFARYQYPDWLATGSYNAFSFLMAFSRRSSFLNA